MLGCKVHVDRAVAACHLADLDSELDDQQSEMTVNDSEKVIRQQRSWNQNGVYSHIARLPELGDMEISNVASANLPIHPPFLSCNRVNKQYYSLNF